MALDPQVPVTAPPGAYRLRTGRTVGRTLYAVTDGGERLDRFRRRREAAVTTRTWTAVDPEPDDHPPVVDPDSVTWVWHGDPDDDLAYGYHQQVITHHDGRLVTTGSCCNDWADIFVHLPDGSRLREATAEEAGQWWERWPNTTAAMEDTQRALAANRGRP